MSPGRAVAIALVAHLLACRGPRSPAAPSLPPPSPDELEAAERAARDELARWTRERDEVLVDFIDPGEAAEHATLPLQPDIDAGKLDASRLFLAGETIFERRFTLREGLGTGRLGRPPPALSRVENAATVGGPDALSCRECHGRGGDDGAGELHQRAWLDGDGRHPSSARPRVPPHLAGLGLVARLAEEMSADLQRQLAAGREAALALRAPRTVALFSKDIAFGEATVRADGSIDAGRVAGVDPDLIVKPFGWKGATPSLRAFVRQAMPQHLGLRPLPERLTALDRPLYVAEIPDEDEDGVARELHEGQITALAVYLALLDVPRVLPPRDPEAARAWRRGRGRFEALGCGECHRPELPLASSVFVERAPGSGAGIAIDVVKDNQQPPALEQFDYVRPLAVPLFSDLRRHDLGPALAERVERGVPASVFLTRPLWGVGDRAYFLHDGRARTLAQAIRLHGGEAQAAADAFGRLDETGRRELEVFLLSLRRAPQARIVP